MLFIFLTVAGFEPAVCSGCYSRRLLLKVRTRWRGHREWEILPLVDGCAEQAVVSKNSTQIFARGGKRPDLFGAVLEYQTFLGSKRRQLTVELGGRKDTNDIQQGAGAVGMRYQQAIGQRFVLRLDAFTTRHEERDTAHGGRLETLIRM